MTSEIVDIFDVQIDALEQFDVVVEQSEVNLEPLTITENGVYTPQGSATGFSKVEANVLPKSTDIVITENGEYYPNDYDVDAFSKVDVDVKPKLEDLTATDNGTYTPSEGFDGFGKVNVDLKGKVKVSSFKVTNDCINEEGRWEGDVLIDTSELTSLGSSFTRVNITSLDTTNWNLSKLITATYCFRLCTNLKKIIGVENWDMSSADVINGMFAGSGLEELDVSKWDIHASRYDEMFANMKSIKKLDLTSWDFSRCNGILYFMTGCSLLETIVGDYSLNDVISNEISVLKGCKVGATYMFENTPLNTASLRAIINGIADLTDTTTQTLTLGATLRAKLTEEDIAIATTKNWTIA